MLINLLTNLINTKTVAEEFVKMAKVEDSSSLQVISPSEAKTDDVAISKESTDSFSSFSDKQSSSTNPSISNIIETITGYSLDDISKATSSLLTTIDAKEESPVSALAVENSNKGLDPDGQAAPSLGMTNNLFSWIAKGFEGVQSFVADPLGTTVDAVSKISDSDIYKQALETVPGLDAFVSGVNKTIVEPLTDATFEAYDYLSSTFGSSTANEAYNDAYYEKQTEQKRYEEQQYLEDKYAERLYLEQQEEQRQEAERLEQEAYEKQQLAQAEMEKEAEEARMQEAYEEELEEQERIKKEKEAKAIAEVKLDQRLVDIANSYGIEIDPCCVSNSELLNKLVRVIDEDSLAEVLATQGKDTSALFNTLVKYGKQTNFKAALSQIVSGANLDTVNIAV